MNRDVQLTERQAEIVAVLEAEPFPILTSADISDRLRAQGIVRDMRAVAGTIGKLSTKGIVSKRPLHYGRPLAQWWRPGIGFVYSPPKHNGWYLTMRVDEVRPTQLFKLWRKQSAKSQ